MAKERTEEQKKKRRSFWIRIVVAAAILIYAGITIVTQQSQIQSAKAQQSKLEAQAAELEQRMAFLERQKENIGTEQYVESEARDKLGWVEEGEIIFRDESVKESPSPAPTETDETADE